MKLAQPALFKIRGLSNKIGACKTAYKEATAAMTSAMAMYETKMQECKDEIERGDKVLRKAVALKYEAKLVQVLKDPKKKTKEKQTDLHKIKAEAFADDLTSDDFHAATQARLNKELAA